MGCGDGGRAPAAGDAIRGSRRWIKATGMCCIDSPVENINLVECRRFSLARGNDGAGKARYDFREEVFNVRLSPVVESYRPQDGHHKEVYGITFQHVRDGLSVLGRLSGGGLPRFRLLEHVLVAEGYLANRSPDPHSGVAESSRLCSRTRAPCEIHS